MDCLPHLHIAALHAEPGYRDDTPGAGVLCRNDKSALAGLGLLRNSVGEISRYALAGWQPLRIGPLKAGAVVGVIDGYPAYNNGGAFPMGGVALSWGHVHALVIPAIAGKSPATFALSVTLPLTP